MWENLDLSAYPKIDKGIDIRKVPDKHRGFLKGDGYDKKRLEFLSDTATQENLKKAGIKDQERQWELYCKHHKSIKTHAYEEDPITEDMLKVMLKPGRGSMKGKTTEEVINSYLKFHQPPLTWEEPDPDAIDDSPEYEDEIPDSAYDNYEE